MEQRRANLFGSQQWNLLRFLAIAFCLYIGSGLLAHSKAKPILKIEKNNSQVIQDYLKVLQKYSQKMCRPGTEEKFWELNKKFRGHGYFIPTLPNDKLDITTILKFLDELKEKEKWIVRLIEGLKRQKNFDHSLKELEDLKKNLYKLVSHKQDFFESSDEKEKLMARSHSKYAFVQYRIQLRNFFKKIPFLLSYKFPVNHLELRREYDRYVGRTDLDGKRKANEVYFFRKIVQDGAHNTLMQRSDRFLRAFIDTINLRLDDERDFISEDLRYDISSAIAGIKTHLKRGPDKKIRRLRQWRKRVQRAIKFYTSLKKNQVQVGDHVETAEQIIDQQFKARYILKDFVLKKQAESYRFWSQQNELNRALFSLSTILFNEVGAIDRPHALERKDVTQVVINRTRDPYYWKINQSDAIYSYLEDMTEKFNENVWLGALFKEGEFSFTYFFIHGNAKIYCPDMSRRGKRLRRENLNLSLDLLREPNDDFVAIRYFSRASMLGRIDMRPLWNNFLPIAERPGVKISKDQKLKAQYQSGNYHYLYNFFDPKGQKYRVIEIEEDYYVLPIDRLEFYTYRNPHFFTYFQVKSF